MLINYTYMYLYDVVQTRSEDGGVVGEGDRDGVGDQRDAEGGTLSGVPPLLCHLCHDIDTRLHAERVVAVENFAHVGIVVNIELELSIFLQEHRVWIGK